MYNDIIQLLEQHRLNEAFTQLRAFLPATGNERLISLLDQAEDTYKYMLQYVGKNMDDPQRPSIYLSLCRTIYELADQGQLLYSMQKGGVGQQLKAKRTPSGISYRELIAELKRIDRLMSQTPAGSKEEEGQRSEPGGIYYQHVKTLDQLFDKTWTSLLWNEEEYRECQEMLLSDAILANDIAVFLSGITLSLIRLFDSRKFQFLIDTYRLNKNSITSHRVVAGIGLAVYYHLKRIELYPTLIDTLKSLQEDTVFSLWLFHLQRCLLLSRETEKMSRKLQEEILPQLMPKNGISPDLKIEDFEDFEGKNPEWESSIENISDSIRTLNDWQKEGFDAFMSAFSKMKNDSFFQTPAHWFYPFDPRSAGLSGYIDEKKKGFITMLFKNSTTCDSDKYSMALTLFKDMNAKQFDGIFSSMDFPDASIAEDEDPFVYMQQYIQDLYRFSKLWIYRTEEHDIFTDKLDLWNNALLRPFFFQGQQALAIAELLLRQGYYEEAAELFRNLSIQNKLPDIWQKLGYAYQQLKQYAEAVKAYRQADVLEPDSVWTLTHMAQCYKHLGDYGKAYESYRQAEALRPDDLTILLQAGKCLATLRKYEEALSCFFKVEYLHKDPKKAQRAIAWCYFMTRRYDDALKYYQKLAEKSQTITSDYLNMGHVFLAQSRIEEAVDCYRKVQRSCKTKDEFIHLFQADYEILKEHEVPKEILFMLPDLL